MMNSFEKMSKVWTNKFSANSLDLGTYAQGMRCDNPLEGDLHRELEKVKYLNSKDQKKVR